MTVEEFLSLPDDGTERSLIRGQLREVRPDGQGQPRTMRDRRHSRVMSRLCHHLEAWLERRQEPRGEILSGEAGFCLRRDPDSFVGIDLALMSPEQAAGTDESTAYPEGPPILAVEILSPSDTQAEIDEKVALYLETGVSLVRVINPRFRTVCVYRRGAEPVLFNALQELTAEPLLPDFRVLVAKIFEV
jgi:Uma2 family endonuclease